MIIRVVPLSILSVQLASRCTSLKYCSQRNLSRYRTSKKHWSDRTGFNMESVILEVMWSLLQLFSILSLTPFNTSGDLVSDWPQWGSLSPAWKHPYRPGANLSSSPLRAGLSTQAIIHPHNGSLVYYHQHQPGSLEKTGRKRVKVGLRLVFKLVFILLYVDLWRMKFLVLWGNSEESSFNLLYVVKKFTINIWHNDKLSLVDQAHHI